MGHCDELFSVKDKRILLTGVNGQLGKALADGFLKAGAHVIGLDVQQTSDMDIAGYYTLDVRDKAAVSNVFNTIGMCDVLINNAGVSVFEPFEERGEDDFDLVMDVNVKGAFWCLQKFVEIFDVGKGRKASVVNIASVYGVASPDFRIYTDCDRKNSEVYGASKAALIQMTRYFAVHLAARNIRVNTISPGGVLNEDNPQGDDFIKNYSSRCPMGRMAFDREMVGAAVYLASEAASYTTGQNIVIDGGLTSW